MAVILSADVKEYSDLVGKDERAMPACPSLAINAPMEATETESVVPPIPGVNAESAVIGVQRTSIGIGDEGDS